MAVAREEILEWLKDMPEGTQVAIDDGGLTLVADVEDDCYLEVGGIPDEEDEDEEEDEG